MIAITTSLAGIYLLSIWMALRPELILALYIVCIGATVWMVFRILKDPHSTDKTFGEYFYQDRPDIRRTGKQ